MPGAAEQARPHPLPENSRHGRLTVRVEAPVARATRSGLLIFDSPAGEQLALAYVPEPAHGGPYRLALLFHGAGGGPQQALDLLLGVADKHRMLLVAPQSSGRTWDLIVNGFGPDVRRIDLVLGEILSRYAVAGALIGGFSDGASYALSVGLVNGDVFDAIAAFSPGFAAPSVTHGRPRVFVSHGIHDRVLPVERCSRRLVPGLRALRYDVTYHEFDGGHEVPDGIMQHAVRWLGNPAG
jgi:poly(3-hydroxybutyrate) depolymerase